MEGGWGGHLLWGQADLLAKQPWLSPGGGARPPVVVEGAPRQEEAHGLGLLGEASPLGDPKLQGHPWSSSPSLRLLHEGGCGHAMGLPAPA